jgi:hypothetical protein
VRIGIKISKASGFFVEVKGWCFGFAVCCYAFVGDCIGVVECRGVGESL